MEGIVLQAFFTLLQSGLWNREPDPACFPLAGEAWQKLYRLACLQTVEGLVYDGVLRLPVVCLPPRELLLKWAVRADVIERQNRRADEVSARLAGLFASHGIGAWLLKGQGVAACYEKPLLRVSGDVDWYFTGRSGFGEANRLVAAAGARVRATAGFSSDYAWKGIVVEHHRRLIDIHNPFVQAFLRRLEKSESARQVVMPLAGGQVVLPSPVLAHVLVNAHILKHSLSFGIGLRQLCDSARVCLAYHEQADGVQLQSIYRQLGMYKWMQQLNSLLTEYLGMPAKFLPFAATGNENASRMMTEMLESGNFGFADERFGRYKARRFLHRFRLNFRYVPAEACWFPLVQFYSRIRTLAR